MDKDIHARWKTQLLKKNMHEYLWTNSSGTRQRRCQAGRSTGWVARDYIVRSIGLMN